MNYNSNRLTKFLIHKSVEKGLQVLIADVSNKTYYFLIGNILNGFDVRTDTIFINIKKS